MISFEKYHGTGNDFIMIDDRNSALNLNSEQIRLMCDRHFGIGADGLIQIRQAKGYDFEMLYYNSDGKRGSLCGNGGRCSVAFAGALGLVTDHCNFLAFDGPHAARIISKNPFVISLQMNEVPVLEDTPVFSFLNTGSPHYVQFRDDVEEMDVFLEGREVRYNDRFRIEGTNVNFVKIREGGLYIRTYERGVEAETLSCGTGVTASVLAAFNRGLIFSSPVTVITPGGKLVVHYRKEGEGFKDIWLEGETVKVFSGNYQLK